MMRAIIYTAIGYWLSRQVYLKYDLKRRASDQEKQTQKIIQFLQKEGWTIKEAEYKAAELMNK